MVRWAPSSVQVHSPVVPLVTAADAENGMAENSVKTMQTAVISEMIFLNLSVFNFLPSRIFKYSNNLYTKIIT